MANNNSTSGTFSWSLDNSNLSLEAFDRCGIRPAHITRAMLKSAYRSLNLELQEYSNTPVDLWEITLEQFYVQQGVATYSLPPETQLVLDVYATVQGIGSNNVDRIMMPISRSDYAQYPNKSVQGFSTTFWFQRLPTPQMTVWPVPDGTSFQSISYYRMKRPADANLGGAEEPDIPYRFIDALAAGYAKRLALKFAPEKFEMLKMEAKEAKALALEEDIEHAPISILPDFSGYGN